jgi:ubiquinol-cytochrome c reductase cytochrome c subunit
MPRANSEGQAPQKPDAFSDQEIQALVAYVGSLGGGPAIPRLDMDAADIVEGGELYRANCQSCHGATAIGGALSFGDYAPDLRNVEQTQIAEAVRVGPGQMPVFDEEVFTDQELASIVRYVEYLQDPADPGGFSLGRVGPVTEGYVIWVAGMGTVILFIRWITRRSPDGERG